MKVLYSYQVKDGEKPDYVGYMGTKWKDVAIDLDKDSAERMLAVLEILKASNDSVFMKTAYKGNSWEGFNKYFFDLMESNPKKWSNCRFYLELIIQYLHVRRPAVLQKLVTLVWQKGSEFYDSISTYFYVYERFSADVLGDLSDDEAAEAALNSPAGVLEVICRREPLPEDEILKVSKYRNRRENIMTHADLWREKAGGIERDAGSSGVKGRTL